MVHKTIDEANRLIRRSANETVWATTWRCFQETIRKNDLIGCLYHNISILQTWCDTKMRLLCYQSHVIARIVDLTRFWPEIVVCAAKEGIRYKNQFDKDFIPGPTRKKTYWAIVSVPYYILHLLVRRIESSSFQDQHWKIRNWAKLSFKKNFAKKKLLFLLFTCIAPNFFFLNDLLENASKSFQLGLINLEC